MTWGTTSCGPINLFTWSSLYPYNYSSNYGGQYQYNVMPSYFTPGQAFGLQNIFNPFYQISQMMNIYSSNFNPFQNMQQMYLNQAAYANGYAIGENIGNNVVAQNLANNIASLKSQLEAALTSDKLTDAQKNQLRELKRQVEALLNKLNDISELQRRGATPQQISTAISQISSEYNELKARVQEVAEAIQEQLAGNDDDPVGEGEDPAAEVTPGGTPQGPVEPGTTPAAPRVGNLDTVSFNADIVAADVDDESVREIVNTMYQKIDGAGSGGIKKYLEENITKDNVVEVMLQWNKHYAPLYAEDDPLGLPETLMDERWMTGDKIAKVMLEALEERLKDYQGVDTEVYNAASVQLAVARRELDSWWSNEDKMSEAINKAHKCIAILMYEQMNAQAA